MNRLRDRSGSVPSSVDPGIIGLPRDAIVLKPLGDVLTFATNPHGDAASPIVGLLFHRCPSAVFRSVSSGVVNSVNRMFRRWLSSHVGQERFVRVAPSFAHCNSNGAVSGIASVPPGVASGDHGRPGRILSSLLSANRFAMSYEKHRRDQLPVTPAALYSSIEKSLPGNVFYISAFARALPDKALVVLIDLIGFSKHREPAEDFARNVPCHDVHATTSRPMMQVCRRWT